MKKSAKTKGCKKIFFVQSLDFRVLFVDSLIFKKLSSLTGRLCYNEGENTVYISMTK